MDKTWKELEDTIKGLTDERINEIAVDIYDYQNTGVLRDDSFLSETAEIFQISVRDVEYYVLEELRDRYKKLVLLLLKNRTSDFLIKA